MNDAKSYFPGFEIGKPYSGGCVAKVIQSKSDNFKVGQSGAGSLNWVKF